MKVVVDLDLVQDAWVHRRKKELGLVRKGQVLRCLVRDAMLFEEKVDERKSEEAQEEFKN